MTARVNLIVLPESFEMHKPKFASGSLKTNFMTSAGMTNIMMRALIATVNENQRLSISNKPRLTKKKAGQAWKIAKMKEKIIITTGFFRISFNNFILCFNLFKNQY